MAQQKPPAPLSIAATLVTGQPESPTVVDRALVSLTDANKARAARLARELETAAAAGDRARAAQLAYEQGELLERRLDNEEGALAAYRRALELDPGYLPNRWALRRLLYRRGLWPELERLIDVEVKRAEVDADRVDLLFERALVSGRRKGGDEQARTALVSASQLASHHQGVLLELERVVARTRDKARLVEVWERLAEAIDQPERQVAYLISVGRAAAATDYKRACRAFDMATQLATGVSTPLAVRVSREALRQADLHGDTADIAGALETHSQVLGAMVTEANSGERRTAAYARMKDLAEVRRRQAHLVRAENPAGAWTALQDALSLAPDDPVLLAELLEVAAELGKYKELVVLAGNWRTSETDAGRARMIAAWCAEARLSTERRMHARILLGAVKATAPGFLLLTAAAECDALAEPIQLQELATAYVEAGHASAEGTWIGPGAERQPDPATAISFYIQAAEVFAYYVATPEATAQARDVLERALAVDPRHPAALEALIELDDVYDQPKRALALCRELAEASPSDRAILERGLRVAITHNVTDSVLEIQRKIVELEPTDCWAGWQLDATLAQHGREDERGGVLATLAKHETDGARRATALVGAARRRERAGDVEAALALYRELVSVCPQDPFVRDAYSEILRASEKWEELVTERLEAARGASDAQAIRRGLREAAWVLEVRLGALARAAEVYDEWLARIPEDRTALEGTARLRAALREPAREVPAREAIAALDQTAEARWLHARSLERAGRHADAIDEYKALLVSDDISVAVVSAALALGDLASASANMTGRIEAIELLAERTSDVTLSSSLYEHAGWLHLLGKGAVEEAHQAFATARGLHQGRAGAQLGAALAAARRNDRAARSAALEAVAGAMPTAEAQAAVWLRASAAATAERESASANERLQNAYRAAPDDPYALVVAAESTSPKRADTSDPFAAVDSLLARAELLARRAALGDDPAEKVVWDLERADTFEQAAQHRDAVALLADVIERDPTNRRAVASVRRIARRVGDQQVTAQASFALAKLFRDRDVQLRLLRDAVAFYDAPGPAAQPAVARTIYQRIVELDPGGTELDRLAEMLRDGSDPSALINMLSDQLARLSGGSASDEPKMIPLLVERAALLHRIGKIDEARDDLDAVLAHVPDHAEAKSLRAEVAPAASETVQQAAVMPPPEPSPEDSFDGLGFDDPPAAPPPPAPEPRASATELVPDLKAFEDEHGAWEMEFTDPEAPKSPELGIGRKTGRQRTSNIIRRVSTPSEERKAVDPTLDDEFGASTAVGQAVDPFGGQTATADLSELQEEERRLASAAAKLEADSVVAATGTQRTERRTATFTLPRASLSAQMSAVERRTTEQQAIVEPGQSTGSFAAVSEIAGRAKSVTAGPTFAEPMRAKSTTSGPTFAEPHRARSATGGSFVFDQKSMVTVAESPKPRRDASAPKARALVAPAIERVDTHLAEPAFEPILLRVPERRNEGDESAAVVMSYNELVSGSGVETAEEALHGLERELAAVADDRAALLAVRLEAGRLSEAGGQVDRARKHYDAALALDGTCRSALRALRRLARDRGDIAEAIRLLDIELPLAATREQAPLLRFRLDLQLAICDHTGARGSLGDADDVARLELAVAADDVHETTATFERLAAETTAKATSEMRGAYQVARGVLALRAGDKASAGRWFTNAAASDPDSPALRLEAIRAGAARQQEDANAALLDFAYKVEREDPVAAAAIALRVISWTKDDGARETLANAAHLAAGAAQRDPLVGRIAAETALVTDEPLQASHAFARWVRCKAVPVERAYAAGRAAELDPKLGRMWAQVLDLDPGDDYAAARLRAVHVAAGAKDQVLDLDRDLAKATNRDVPLVRAASELIRERRIDEAISLLESTREYRPSWILAETLADAYAAAKKWGERARVLSELASEPGLLAADVVRLRSAFASDRAARGSATSTESRERQELAALEAWNRVLADDPRSVVGHAAAIAHASRLDDQGMIVKVIARARSAERSSWGATSLSLRYGRMLLGSNPRLAQTIAREAAAVAEDPRGMVARIMAAARRKELPEAITALEERAVLRDTSGPTEAALLRLRAACLALDLGEVPRARQLLARVDKALPGVVDDLLDVARQRAGEPAPSMPKQRAVPDGLSRLVRDGDLAAARGDTQLALHLYQRAVAPHPEDAFAAQPFVRVALKLRAIGPLTVFARAQLRLADERKDSIGRADAQELLARVEELRGDMPAALTALEQAFEHDPMRLDLGVQIISELATTSQHGKLFALRSAELERAKADPHASERDRAALLVDCATLATLDNRSDDVIGALYHAVLALDPKNRMALFHLEALVRKARALESQAAIEDHIAGAHDDPQIRATFLTRAGETLADQGMRAAAVRRFASAVALVPDHLPALEAWHDTALAGELWPELAEAATRKAALGGAPGDVAALHHFAGVVLMDKGRAREAATIALLRALELEPRKLDALLRIRILLEHTSQREQYAVHLRRLLETETDRRAQLELHRLLAEDSRVAGQRDEAIRQYRAMLAIDPADARAHAAIADMSTQQNDWRVVVDAISARIPLERDVQVLRSLYRRLGALWAEHEPSEAIRAYERALSFRPDDDDVLVQLTDLAIVSAQWEVAVSSCDRLVTTETDPDRLAMHLHRAAMIFHRGFNDDDRARRMTQLAVERAPANIDSLQLTIQFYQEIGDSAGLAAVMARVAGLMQARIESDPRDPAAYVVLARSTTGRVARAAAEMALILGAGGDLERHLAADEPAPDVTRLLGPAADDELFAGSSEPKLREVFRRLAEPIAKHVGVDVGVHGVGRKDRLKAPHPAITIAKTIANLIGLKDVEVYVSRQPYLIAAEPTSPVSLVVGEAIASGNPILLRFAAGAALKLAQLSLAVPARLAPGDLTALTLALLRLLGDAPIPGGDTEVVQVHLQKLRKLAPSSTVAELRAYAPLEGGASAQALARDLKIAGLRAGLAASGSLGAALTAFAGAVGARVQDVLSDPIARGLIAFALSEARNPH